MVDNDSQRVHVSGYLTVTVRSRISKSEKRDAAGEGNKQYKSYYMPLLKDDLWAKGLSEGDRVTLGIIRIEKAERQDS